MKAPTIVYISLLYLLKNSFGIKSCSEVAQLFTTIQHSNPIFDCPEPAFWVQVLGERTFKLRGDDGESYLAKVSPLDSSEDQAGEPSARDRFWEEVRLSERLKNKNFLSICRTIITGGDGYQLSKISDPKTLAAKIREWKNDPISVREILEIFLQVIEGLKALHQEGWVHSNLNTKNVWMKGPSVKISGLKKATPMSARVPAESQGVFRDPRCLGHFQDCLHDEFTDVRSAGILLYELVSHGKSPFSISWDGDQENVLTEGSFRFGREVHWLPAFLVQACLTVDVENRPTIDEIIKFLGTYLKPGTEIPDGFVASQEVEATVPADLRSLKPHSLEEVEPVLPKVWMEGHKIVVEALPAEQQALGRSGSLPNQNRISGSGQRSFSRKSNPLNLGDSRSNSLIRKKGSLERSMAGSIPVKEFKFSSIEGPKNVQEKFGKEGQGILKKRIMPNRMFRKMDGTVVSPANQQLINTREEREPAVVHPEREESIGRSFSGLRDLAQGIGSRQRTPVNLHRNNLQFVSPSSKLRVSEISQSREVEQVRVIPGIEKSGQTNLRKSSFSRTNLFRTSLRKPNLRLLGLESNRAARQTANIPDRAGNQGIFLLGFVLILLGLGQLVKRKVRLFRGQGHWSSQSPCPDTV